MTKAGCLSYKGRPAAVRLPRHCSGWRTCCTNTARRSGPIRSFFSHRIRCLPVISPPSFRSSVKRICSRRLFRNISTIGWVPRLRPEDPFDQIEYVLTAQGAPGYEARLQGIEYKASEAFLQALQNYANVVGAGGHAIQRYSVSRTAI